MLPYAAFVRTDVPEERSASIIEVTRIGELRSAIVFLCCVLRLPVTDNVVRSSPIVTLVMEGIRPRKRWFLQEPHSVHPKRRHSS
jgi:hypothetical protein